MDKIKSDKNKINTKQINSNKSNEINTFLFDETLSQIENMLKNLDEKIEPNEELNKNLQKKIINKNEEHEIDNTHIRMEELHDFDATTDIKKKNAFGFYTYLALAIVVIIAIYEILNYSKNLIVFKYPFTEPYIKYFYEVIEILTYVLINIISFVKNLFFFGAP